MKKLLSLPALLFFFASIAHAQAWAGILAPARATDWTQAGFPGSSIPSTTWPQCGSTLPVTGLTIAAINSALSACGGLNEYVLIGIGQATFSSGQIAFPTSGHVELRGSGTGSTNLTKLVYTGSGANCNANAAFICGASSDGTYGGQPPANFYVVTGGLTNGSTSITVSANPTTITAGKVMVIDQYDTGFSGPQPGTGTAIDNGALFICQDTYTATPSGCSLDGPDGSDPGPNRGNRGQALFVMVTSVSGTTINFTPPLIGNNWSTATTQVWSYTPISTFGIRNLELDMTGDTSSTGFGTQNSAYAWMTGVKIHNVSTYGTNNFDAFAFVATNNYEDNCQSADPYLIRFENSAFTLIQNNIGVRCLSKLVYDGTDMGSVEGYNAWWDGYSANHSVVDFMKAGYFGHSVCQFHLAEGNWSPQDTFDDSHGTCDLSTFAFNFYIGWESCGGLVAQCGPPSSYGGSYPAGTYGFKDSNTNAIAQEVFSRYNNNVFNVLGASVYHTSYENAGNKSIAQIGVANTTGGGVPIPADSLALSSAMMWGNYDTFNATTRFVSSENAHSDPTYPGLSSPSTSPPASFYLGSSRPSWWPSTLPYPAIHTTTTGGAVGQCSGTLLNAVNQYMGLPSSSAGNCTGTSLITPAWGGHLDLIPAANCLFNVMGQPLDGGTTSDYVFDPVACGYVSGSGPQISFSPSSVSFGTVTVGNTTSPTAITVTNPGTSTLTISGISITGTNAGDFAQTNNCGSAVASGGSCTVNVTFTPSATGARSASVSVADNAPSSPQTVPLSGTGAAAAAAVSFSPTSLAFGNQQVATTSAGLTTTLTNTGTATLTISSIAITGTNTGDFSQTNTCGSSVVAGGSCTITVKFTPSATGARSANVSVTDNAAGSPQTVPLTGTGTAAAVSLFPASLAFGNQAVSTTSSPMSTVLTNTGGATLTISNITIVGTNPGDFAQTNTCGSSVAAGGSCSINVTFTPAATGARSASVSVADSASGSPQTVPLTGTGTTSAPAISLSPTSLTFGLQNVGTASNAQAIVVRNTGTATLTFTSIAITGANAGDFGQTNNCGSSLAAGGACSVLVTFMPTAVGSRSAAVTFTDNAAGSPQTVALSGTGIVAQNVAPDPILLLMNIPPDFPMAEGL